MNGSKIEPTSSQQVSTLQRLMIKLPNVKLLYTSGCDLSTLDGCTSPSLEELYCGGASSGMRYVEISKLQSISQVQNCPRLLKLDISFSCVEDLSPLASCPLLEWLVCCNSCVVDLTPVSSCKRLKEIDCSGNRMNDLTPLASCPLLGKINCSGTRIRDITPLADLIALKLVAVNEKTPLLSAATYIGPTEGGSLWKWGGVEITFSLAMGGDTIITVMTMTMTMTITTRMTTRMKMTRTALMTQRRRRARLSRE